MPRPFRDPTPAAPRTATVYLKRLRCPGCDRPLPQTGGTSRAPTFHCDHCHHTWSWTTPHAAHIVIKATRPVAPTGLAAKPVRRWR